MQEVVGSSPISPILFFLCQNFHRHHSNVICFLSLVAIVIDEFFEVARYIFCVSAGEAFEFFAQFDITVLAVDFFFDERVASV